MTWFLKLCIMVLTKYNRMERITVMKRIIIVAESGSDVSPQLAEKYGIEIVP